MNTQFGMPEEDVEAKVQKGEYEELLSSLTSRKKIWYVGEAGFRTGMHRVDMAALNRIHKIMHEEITPFAHLGPKKKGCIDELKKIMETQELGEQVKAHARNDMELLDIRMQTPKKVRWLHGVGGVPLLFRIASREGKIMHLLRRQ